MKNYTDLEQSKILAGILPPESADMVLWGKDLKYVYADIHAQEFMKGLEDRKMNYVPCWSLAALLEQLKAEIILENKQILFIHLNKYNDTDYDIRYTNSWTGEVLIVETDNLVDACVAMIEKLHELNLL